LYAPKEKFSAKSNENFENRGMDYNSHILSPYIIFVSCPFVPRHVKSNLCLKANKMKGMLVFQYKKIFAFHQNMLVVQYQKIFTYESVICSKVLTIKGPWLKR
jgi:hypothetical protein